MSKYYAVVNGREPGIYRSWDACKQQVHKFSSAQYKSFATAEEAEAFLSRNNSEPGRLPGVYPEKLPTQASSPQPVVRSASRSGDRLYNNDVYTHDPHTCSLASETLLDSDSRFKLMYDGACRGNPGLAAAGAVLTTEAGAEVGSISVPLGRQTNNVAEYYALLHGMKAAEALGIKRLHVQGDSLLVAQQIKGAYRVGSDSVRPLHEQVMAQKSRFTEFHIEQVPRRYNTKADSLANLGLDEGGWNGVKTPQGMVDYQRPDEFLKSSTRNGLQKRSRPSHPAPSSPKPSLTGRAWKKTRLEDGH